MDVVPHTQIAKMAHDVKQLQNMMDAFDELYTTIFVAGTDFGPGRRGGKNVLLKPGAEKIFGLFNLTARTSVTEQECDHKQGFFLYRVVCEALALRGDGRRSYGGLQQPGAAPGERWRPLRPAQRLPQNGRQAGLRKLRPAPRHGF